MKFSSGNDLMNGGRFYLEGHNMKNFENRGPSKYDFRSRLQKVVH
jgi:hypothetical protein